MKKRFSVLFALFSALILIAGCGKDSKKKTEPVVETPAAETEFEPVEKSEPVRANKVFADGVIIYNNVGLYEVNPADSKRLRWIGALPKGQFLQVEAEPGKVIEGVKAKYPWLLGTKDEKTTDMACIKLDNADKEYYVSYDCVIGNARPCVMIGKEKEDGYFGQAYTEMKATKVSKITIPAGTIGAVHTGADVEQGWVKVTFRVEPWTGAPKGAFYLEKFYKEDQISTDDYDILLAMLFQRSGKLENTDEEVNAAIRGFLYDISAPHGDIIFGQYK